MKFTPKLEAQFINESLELWQKDLDKALREQLKAKAGRVPHETINKLKYAIAYASPGNLQASIELWFQDSGRLVEIKNKKFKGQLPVDVIADWVDRNYSRFEERSEIKRRKPLSRKKRVQAIAWAIAVAKGKNTADSRRRKENRWYNKTLYSLVSALIEGLYKYQAEFLRNTTKAEIIEAVGKIKL